MTRNNSDWQTACLACGATCYHYGSGRPKKYCSVKCNLSVNRPKRIRLKPKSTVVAFRRGWTKQWLMDCQMARGNCMDCGYVQTYETNICFHWDHRDPLLKCFELGHPPAKTSKEKMIEEMDKCDVVCANCHALRPTSRRGGVVLRQHEQLDLGGLFAS